MDTAIKFRSKRGGGAKRIFFCNFRMGARLLLTSIIFDLLSPDWYR